jgi:hypothetical protein
MRPRAFFRQTPDKKNKKFEVVYDPAIPRNGERDGRHRIQPSPPFQVTQLVVLALLVVLGIRASVKFRHEGVAL